MNSVLLRGASPLGHFFLSIRLGDLLKGVLPSSVFCMNDTSVLHLEVTIFSKNSE